MDEIERVLTRGVEQILPNKEGLSNLMRERKITIYQGFDPSSHKLHIGNLIGIRKLAEFQKLGHKIIFLIGDFTGMIGDPTDKTATRQKLTRDQVLNNAKGFKEQISKFLNFEGDNAVEIKYNSEWLDKLNGVELLELMSNFTVQQMIERDFFQERLKAEKPIYLHEFLYPVMQAYDSMTMGVDLEIGGNDQLFNMMAGRNLIKSLKDRDKYVLTMKLMVDPVGAKMGKSTGNTINLTDLPNEIFGKVMSLPDSLMALGIELLTDLSLDFASDKSPIEIKKGIAFEITKQIYDENEAKSAQEYFEKTFQQNDPDFSQKVIRQDTLASTASAIVGTMSETKRLIKQGGVDVNQKVETDPAAHVNIGDKLKIGKTWYGTVVDKLE